MIPEVEGTRPWGPPRRRVPKCLKWPNTTYTNIAIAEKQSKRSQKVPPGPTQEMEFMGPGGEGPSQSPPRFLRPCEQVLAEYEDFLSLSDPNRPGPISPSEYILEYIRQRLNRCAD